jgi:hypothetical protein
LQVFHTNVAEVDRGCCICCNGCTCMLQVSALNDSSVFSDVCCNVFIKMLHMFHIYIVSGLS